MFIAALLIITPKLEATNMSFNRQVDKEKSNMVEQYKEISYQAIQRHAGILHTYL